jgi:hypothetical protein
VVGIVVSLVLIVGLVLGRGTVVDRVDQLAARVDDGLAKASPVLETASTRVSEVSARVGELVLAAEARAADPGPAAEKVQALLEKANELSDRYLALRASYAEARDRIANALAC